MSNQKQTNKDFSRELSNRRLQPLIDWCRINKGQAEVVRRLNEKLPEPVTLTHIWFWLHPDPRRRKQPVHGMGVLLEQIAGEVVR
jgi:hypothetical protein